MSQVIDSCARSIDARSLGFAGLALWVAVLSGCAEHRYHTQALQAAAAGDYARSVGMLETGLKDLPESVLLRGDLVKLRAEGQARLVAQVGSLRAAGRFDDAMALLEQARRLDASDARVAGLIEGLRVERSQQAAQLEAERLLADKRPEAALKVVLEALKDNGRHAGLLALQRSLEQDQRRVQIQSAQATLGEQRPISLDFREASLRTVLDVVSRNSGVNFILDKDIRPDARVTVFLRNARVEDALDLIVGSHQLAKKVVDKQTVVIYPNTPEKQREHQEQVVRVFYLASADAKGAAAFLKSMLKIRDPFVDERSNMLALRDSQENVQLAERLVALYDTDEPEALLEVEVMEISSSKLTELGVKYPDAFSLTALPPGGETGLTLSNIRDLDRGRVALGVAGLLVNLKREVGDVTTLANPKIRARNKEKAKVLIGDKIPVVTSTTGQGGFVSDSVRYLDVGISLDVEPTVYGDDDVAIKIALEVSSLGAAVKTASGTLAYQIGTRSASTTLRLRDNETQLLAGLISREDRTTSSRVPGLGDLPVLGRLFSSQRDNAQRTELVLAITPRILRNTRRPAASETELWVGTEMQPKLRPVGGLRVQLPVPEAGKNAVPPAMEPKTAAGGEPVKKPEASIELRWKGPTTAKVGDVLEFNLALNANVDVRGLPTQLKYDRDRLQLLEVAEGNYFGRDGAAVNFTKSVDATEGQLGLGLLRSPGTGVAGEGSVASVRFKALKVGVAELSIERAQAIGVGAPPPPVVLHAPHKLEIR